MDVATEIASIFDKVIEGHECLIFKQFVDKYSIFGVYKLCRDINYKRKQEILNMAMKVQYQESHPEVDFPYNIYAL